MPSPAFFLLFYDSLHACQSGGVCPCTQRLAVFSELRVMVDRTGGAACKGVSVSTLQPALGHLDSKPSSKSNMLRGRNSATSADEQPHIGNYRLLKTIGKGNFAKVKLARHILTGKEVSTGVGAMAAAPILLTLPTGSAETVLTASLLFLCRSEI